MVDVDYDPAAPHDIHRDEAPPFDHQSTSSSSARSAEFPAVDFFDEADRGRRGSVSSRSSISSIPASVMVYPTSSATKGISQKHNLRHGSKRTGNGRNSPSSGYSQFRYSIPRRDRTSGFRNPSSVREMQMRDEEEYGSLGGGMAAGASYGGMSMRSFVSSPVSVKSGYRSHGSPPVIKKEYPLVLLHCTILPPSLSLPLGLTIPNERLLKDVLPEKYWRRWKLLEDKVVASGLLRDRGVLISHPQDAYDLLEERLLESLELIKPRLSDGHFLERSQEDNNGIDPQESDSDEGQKCADCGCKVRSHPHDERKWEVRVYAANGLMRAGAWAVAWREMEKVDVEVAVSLPADLKRELERRIVEDQSIGRSSHDGCLSSAEEIRRCEIYGDGSDSSPECLPPDIIEGLSEEDARDAVAYLRELNQRDSAQSSPPPALTHESKSNGVNPPMAKDIDTPTFLGNYIRILLGDSRNVALGFLSILVIYLATFVARDSVPTTGIIPLSSNFSSVLQSFPSVSTTERVVTSAPQEKATRPPVLEVPVRGPVQKAVEEPMSMTNAPKSSQLDQEAQETEVAQKKNDATPASSISFAVHDAETSMETASPSEVESPTVSGFHNAILEKDPPIITEIDTQAVEASEAPDPVLPEVPHTGLPEEPMEDQNKLAKPQEPETVQA